MSWSSGIRPAETHGWPKQARDRGHCTKRRKAQQKNKKRKRRVHFEESKRGKAGRPYGPWGVAPRGRGTRQSQPQKRLRETFKAAELTLLLQSKRQGAPALKEMRGM